MTPTAPWPLELSGEAIRRMVHRTTEAIVAHLEGLPRQPVHATTGGRKLARSLREPMPERGAPFEDLLGALFQRVIPASLNTASPGLLAYVPGGGLFHAALADLITGATNRYVGLFQAAPGLVQLEANVIAWFAAMLGLPETAGGVMTTGGSLSNLIAVVTARRERLPQDFLRGVVYASDQAHHSVHKAAIFAGFPAESVREIPTDARFRMRPDALEDAVRGDRARGLTPFLAVATAGTTGTGAVDDLAAIADVAARERLWLHVDAAYGGFFALTERGRAALRGVERADSVALDPHKSLFLPYGTGCLLVRDRGALARAHALGAAYLPPMQTEEGLVDFCDLGPELSRDMRGLRVWLPLKMHGAATFRAALDEKLDLARRAAEALARMPDVELIAAPELSVLAFRARPAGVPDEALDAWNRRLVSRVNARQRVLLAGGLLRGRFAIRLGVLSFRTHEDRVDAALEDIAAAIAELRRGPGA